jgi:hypothetical protein
LDIKERLAAIKDADGEALFQHFDLWNRQIAFLSENTGFLTPAVFVEFGRISWRTLSNRVQDAELTVRLHIVTEWFAGTADYSPTEHQSLLFLNIADRVVAAMQGFATSYMNSWMRTESLTDHNHETFCDNVEEYRCNLRDLSAVLQPVPVTPDLNVRTDD